MNIIHKTLGGTGLIAVAFLVANVAFAASMSGDTIMKKDDTMMQKDAMKSGESMMMESDLYFGSRGEAVVALQTLLEGKGLLAIPAGVAKGYFGSLTKAAVMKYQTTLGVKSTGYYGPLTRASMKSMMMEKKDGAMMDKGDTMMKKDDVMMKDKAITP